MIRCHHLLRMSSLDVEQILHHILTVLTWESFLKNMGISLEAPHFQKFSNRIVCTWCQRYLSQIYKAKSCQSKLASGQMRRLLPQPWSQKILTFPGYVSKWPMNGLLSLKIVDLKLVILKDHWCFTQGDFWVILILLNLTYILKSIQI